MIIDGQNLPTLAVFKNCMTVPDCNVVASNKVGQGHGEAKFYIGPKDAMYEFYGNEDFKAHCFMLKKDLIAYMNAIRNEYMNPSFEYAQKDLFPRLWHERMNMINSLEDVIYFDIRDQNQIEGSRGYVNSQDKGYQIIRQIALPNVSYICVEKVGKESAPLFYWRLFVDFDAIWQHGGAPLVFTYGKQKKETIESKKQESRNEAVRQSREGQGKYREQLLEQCHFCPFTLITEERILIASHIKPWAASNDDEKIDPYNGYILSPMFDKLFDKGFITFTEDRRLILSEYFSANTWKQIGVKNGEYYEYLKMDDKRIKYLNFHHESVFKGVYTDAIARISSSNHIYSFPFKNEIPVSEASEETPVSLEKENK